MAHEAPVSILLLGTGVVGSALIEMLASGTCAGDVALSAVANTRGVVPTGGAALTAADVHELLARPRTVRATSDVASDEVLDAHARRSCPVLVDATAARGMERFYERALARGIHVVTANKKPLVVPWVERQSLFDAGRRTGGARLRYEATVGAGLPVIETLKDLVRTGDRVDRIECVLSGTLGFIANELAAGTRLSRAVAIAKERGYTEPDPREDLGGADVARKACILARELGAPLETSDVALEPFVPAAVLGGSEEGRDLHHALESLDDEHARRVAALNARGEKLVYLARIQRGAAGTVRASAGPVALPSTHPAARLEGPRALVAFTTARYADAPLVVSGSGAGGAVTATALLADVLKVTGRA